MCCSVPGAQGPSLSCCKPHACLRSKTNIPLYESWCPRFSISFCVFECVCVCVFVEAERERERERLRAKEEIVTEGNPKYDQLFSLLSYLLRHKCGRWKLQKNKNGFVVLVLHYIILDISIQFTWYFCRNTRHPWACTQNTNSGLRFDIFDIYFVYSRRSVEVFYVFRT